VLAFAEMAIFVAILVLGLAYVWRKGDLDWVKVLAPREREELRPLSRFSSPGRTGPVGGERELEGADVR